MATAGLSDPGRIARCGRWNNGSNAGVAYVNGNNVLSNRNSNVGSRLTATSDSRTRPCHLAEDHGKTRIAGLVGLPNVRPRLDRREPMKRIAGAWEKIVDMDTLREAAKRSCRARRNKLEVAAFLEDEERKLSDLRDMLIDGSYHTSAYRFFRISENGKQRVIADLPLYPDRIVHWAVALAIEEPLNRKLIDQTYGSRPGGGHHRAVRQLERYVRGDSRVRYALSMDIRQFFPSIDREVLKSKLRDAVKDRRALELLELIVDEYPRDGIPLGNRTSPMLANLYLSDMDHEIKQRLRCHYYLRYMDDMVVLGYSKQWLHRIRRRVSEVLEGIGLELKGDWQVYPIEQGGIPYLGYRVYRTHTLLRKRTKNRMKRAMRRIRDAEGLAIRDLGAIRSYEGVLSWCDGRHLAETAIGPALRAHGLERTADRRNPDEIRHRNRMGPRPGRLRPRREGRRDGGRRDLAPTARRVPRKRRAHNRGRPPSTPLRDHIRGLPRDGVRIRGHRRGRQSRLRYPGVYGEAESLPQAYRKEIVTALTGGRLGDAFQVIAVAEGMDPSLPPQTISRAVLARSSARREAERRSALTDFVMAEIASGARIEYWDAVSHLYTASEMEEIRRRRAEAEERRRQMEAVKDMTDMSRQLFGK